MVNQSRKKCLPDVILTVTGHSVGFNHVTEMATLLPCLHHTHWNNLTSLTDFNVRLLYVN